MNLKAAVPNYEGNYQLLHPYFKSIRKGVFDTQQKIIINLLPKNRLESGLVFLFKLMRELDTSEDGCDCLTNR